MQPYGALDCFGWRSEGGAGGNEGKTQGGLPLGNPVCLWQTELFKLNLKSSPSSSGYNRRRRLATRSSGKQQAERTAVRTAPIVCPEESPLARPQVQASFSRWGLTRRLRRGSMAAVILWGSFAHFRGPKVSKGRAESPLVRPQAHNFCRRGLTRRLRRGRWGCRPDGGSYFLSTRKKVPKKASGTALRKKGSYCPFCRRGSQCRAQFSWIANTNVRARSCAHLFPPSKWAGLFPSAAYRRPAPAQLAGDILNPCRVGCNGAA